LKVLAYEFYFHDPLKEFSLQEYFLREEKI